MSLQVNSVSTLNNVWYVAVAFEYIKYSKTMLRYGQSSVLGASAILQLTVTFLPVCKIQIVNSEANSRHNLSLIRCAIYLTKFHLT